MSRKGDGVDDVIASGAGVIASPAAYTIHFWYRNDTAAGSSYSWPLTFGNATWGVVLGTTYGDGNFLVPTMHHRLSSGANAVKAIPVTLTANVWHSITLRWDGSNINCVADGTFSTNAAAASIASGTLTAYTHSDRGTTQFDDGDVSQASYWNAYLSDSEVRELHAGVVPGFVRTSGLGLWWPLDSPTASQAEDLSGNARNGTVTGCTVSDDPPISFSASTPARVFLDLDLVSKDLAARWDTKTLSGVDDIAGRWHVRSAIAKSVQGLWNERNAIGNPLVGLWNVRGAAGQALNVEWHDLAATAKSLGVQWNTHIAASRDLDARWALSELVSDDLNGSWNVRGIGSSNLGANWNAIANVSSPLSVLWNDRFTVPDDLAGLWNVNTSSGVSLEALWAYRQLVSSALAGVWDLEALAGRSLQSLWGVGGFVGRDLSAPWNVLITSGTSLDAPWNARRAAASPLTGLWFTRELTTWHLTARWNVAAPPLDLAGVSLQALWSIDANAASALVAYWKVRGFLAPDLNPELVTFVEEAASAFHRESSGADVFQEASGAVTFRESG